MILPKFSSFTAHTQAIAMRMKLPKESYTLPILRPVFRRVLGMLCSWEIHFYYCITDSPLKIHRLFCKFLHMQKVETILFQTEKKKKVDGRFFFFFKSVCS